MMFFFFFFSSRRRHTRWNCDWSSDVCSSDLTTGQSPISGVAPYWRLAVEANFGDHSWEVGTFGLASKVFPMRLSGAGTDSFTDIGIDTQYQYLGDPHTVTARVAWIHENHNTSASQTLGLTNNSNNQLRSL